MKQLSAFIVLVTAAVCFAQPPVGIKPLTPLSGADALQTRGNVRVLPLRVRNEADVARPHTIVRGGVPFAKGALAEADDLAIHDDTGNRVDAQFKVLSRWWDYDNPDAAASVKWLLVTFPASVEAGATRTYELRIGETSAQQPHIAADLGGDVLIDTGVVKALFSKQGLQQIEMNGRALLRSPAHVFADLKYEIPAPEHRWTDLKLLTSESDWRFRTGEHGDDADPNLTDSTWQTIDPFHPWENQGHEYYDGVAWYRCHFRAVPGWGDRPVYLELRHFRQYQTQALTTYLNGKPIDEITGGHTPKPGDLQKRILLPADLIRPGDNVIALRFDDGGAGESGLMAAPRLASPHDQKRDGAWVDRSGMYTSLRANDTEVALVENGPFAAVVRVAGTLADPRGLTLTQYETYYRFFKDTGRIGVSLTYTQTENPANHFYKAIGLNIPLDLPGDAQLFSPAGDGGALGGRDASLHQFHDGLNRYPGFPTLLQHPLNLKWQLTDGSVIAEGDKTTGWLAVSSPALTVGAYQRDFWENYPSQLAVSRADGVRLYMWPAAGRAMDMRNWYMRGEGGLDAMNEILGRDITQDNGLERSFIQTPEHLPVYNSVGCAWTREFTLDLAPRPRDAAAFAAASRDCNEPILPFVNPAYNAQTDALGVPIHACDPDNYPLMERWNEGRLEWSRHLQWDKLAIYGMWHHGALRYEFETADEIRETYKKQRNFGKRSWDRRWFNHERGVAPSRSFWAQYFRTGDTKWLDVARAVSRLDSRVLTRTWHPAPSSTGYAFKHRKQLFSYANPSHTNLEGIAADYLMTGDEWTGDYLRKLEQQYQRERMVNFGGHTGEYTFHRGHQSAVTCRAVLWFINGAPAMRDWVSHGLNYFAEMNRKGFTCYRPSYHEDQMTRTWYYTRTPLALDNGAAPLRYFVDGNPNSAFNQFVFEMKNHNGEFNWLKEDLTDDQLRGKLYASTPEIAVPDFNVGLVQAALYRAGLPVYDYANATNGSMYENYWPSQSSAQPMTKGFTYKPLDIRAIANADPYAVTPIAWPMIEGEYCLDKGTLPDYDATLKQGEIAWDFGPLEHRPAHWRPAYGDAQYPTIAGYEHAENLSGIPFGTRFSIKNVAIGLIDPATNNGLAMYKSKTGDRLTLPVGERAAQVAFIGHIQQDMIDMTVPVGVTYDLVYADGSTDTHDMKPGAHYDDWRQDRAAANVVSSSRLRRFLNHPGDRYGVHFNIYTLRADPDKTLDHITLRAHTDGFILMGVSVETPKPMIDPQPQTLHEGDPIGPSKSFAAPLANGWYDVTVRFMHDNRRDSNPINVIAEGDVVTAGFIYKLLWRVPELTFPVEVRDGELNLSALTSEGPHQKGCIETITATPRSAPPTWATPRARFDPQAVYGMRHPSVHVGFDCIIDYPARDAVTRDWVDVSNNGFTAHVPNGAYDVEALLQSPQGTETYNFTINGEATSSFDLPSQQVFYPAPFEHTPYETIRDTVTVTNGTLQLSFPRGYRNQAIGLRGLKLTPR